MTSNKEHPEPFDARSAELDEWGPRANATAGQPVESGETIYEDAHVHIGLWECTEGTFPVNRGETTEVSVVVHGVAEIGSPGLPPQQVSAGSVVTSPAGWTGTWTIRETLRKFFIVVKNT